MPELSNEASISGKSYPSAPNWQKILAGTVTRRQGAGLNANIAVLGDAELIVALKATADKAQIVTRGSIDHPETCEAACNVLEGSREAFDRRAVVYGVARRG
jgi:hypothetical protein